MEKARIQNINCLTRILNFFTKKMGFVLQTFHVKTIMFRPYFKIWKKDEGVGLVKRWESPPEHTGPNLLVPYRFAAGNFTDQERTDIEQGFAPLIFLTGFFFEFF